jgi:hypothetical protein
MPLFISHYRHSDFWALKTVWTAAEKCARKSSRQRNHQRKLLIHGFFSLFPHPETRAGMFPGMEEPRSFQVFQPDYIMTE